jgi:hypothetical protein
MRPISPGAVAGVLLRVSSKPPAGASADGAADGVGVDGVDPDLAVVV